MEGNPIEERPSGNPAVSIQDPWLSASRSLGTWLYHGAISQFLKYIVSYIIIGYF